MPMYAREDECEAAGVSVAEIEKLARTISTAGKKLKAMGVTVFGGAYSGSLRKEDSIDSAPLILAYLEGSFDGGDGGASLDGHGLLRGEV